MMEEEGLPLKEIASSPVPVGRGRNKLVDNGERKDRDPQDRRHDQPAGDLLEAEERAAEEGQGARHTL
ncbi:unnamed protein product [Musa hybrid cultivar]